MVIAAAPAAALVGCLPMPGSSAADLLNPFDASALRSRKGRPAPRNAACTLAPPPPRDLTVPTFYTDPPVYSRIDPERLAARNAAVLPLQRLAQTVTENADRWAASAPADGRFAACAAGSLDAAASAGSLLGTVDSQGGFERKWLWCGLALAHLKLASAPEYDAAAQARVRGWLLQGFGLMRVPYDRPPGAPPSSQLNNHMTWAGLTAMAIGIAANDRTAWDWGVSRMWRTLEQVDADGFLPQELQRGSRAMHYHVFTMEPLSMGAWLASANGLDLAGKPDGPFHRVARRTIGGYSSTAAFTARTGREQESWGDQPDVGWLEIYAAMFGVPEAAPLLRSRRPIRKPWLGGDLTLWFAGEAG